MDLSTWFYLPAINVYSVSIGLAAFVIGSNLGWRYQRTGEWIPLYAFWLACALVGGVAHYGLQLW